ncbi:MAG: DUF3105 domain-containing protein [Candidatus Manganitrophaceae bacterium]|nr:MAG: DUF3105 domain-containing protein [Candidatus Manganitrophaceae bacterium]
MRTISIGTILFALILFLNGPLQAAPPKAPAKGAEKNKSAEKAEEKEPGTTVPSLGNDHIQSIESPHPPYNSKPPTSGPHVPFVARWGIYTRQIPNELQVHNLEDGGVIIQYDCKDCSEMIQKIEAIAKDYLDKSKMTPQNSRFGHLLVAPYPGLDTPIALTAWGKIDKLSTFDEARIRRFIEAYIGIDHHPSHPE